jgi:hypothetical protein
MGGRLHRRRVRCLTLARARAPASAGRQGRRADLRQPAHKADPETTVGHLPAPALTCGERSVQPGRRPVHAFSGPRSRGADCGGSPGCRQRQPSVTPASGPRMGPAPACPSRLPSRHRVARPGSARDGCALRCRGPGRCLRDGPPRWLQCGGGARGRRPHSRPADRPCAWSLIRPRSAGRRHGPPRAWAGERGRRQRAAAAAAEGRAANDYDAKPTQ